MNTKQQVFILTLPSNCYHNNESYKIECIYCRIIVLKLFMKHKIIDN